MRLGDVAWFRTDWQRGGAATGRSTWRDDDGAELPVVVKLPVPHRELDWTRSLQVTVDDAAARTAACVPRLFAGDHRINGYDMAWLVIEDLPVGPLGMKWHDDHIPRMAEALAEFHAGALRARPVDAKPRIENWTALLTRAASAVRRNELAESERWLQLIQSVEARLDGLVDLWRARSVDGWIHGDAHLANAMSRVAIDHGPVCLIDLAEVRAGSWIEDAIYLERMLWARPQRLAVCSPVTAIAEARRSRGLPVDDDAAILADIRRILLAVTAPAFLHTEGHPAHLAACLDQAEAAIERVDGAIGT
ncbi:MAG: aminoglycoside phosphotransferase family protein [Phycisphaerales bacterium]